MVFHLLGGANARTSKEFFCCPFTQKIRLLSKMLVRLGHTVYFYGTEGSDPVCTENVSVLPASLFEKLENEHNSLKTGNPWSDKTANRVFAKNAIRQIKKRLKPGDFLLCMFGRVQKNITDAFPQAIVVEPGIGHNMSFTRHRIFESYAWMHTVYGQEKIEYPSFYDAVIPAYYDLEDYRYSAKKDDYFFFVGRPTPLKGLDIAVSVVEEIGGKLYVAGRGNQYRNSRVTEFIGLVNIRERARWMSRAKATFIPTLYVEPFGSVLVESLLCGTPVITTDFGAFTETVLHGKVGYRCRTMEQFVWAARHIDKIRPRDCRKYAEENYSLKRIEKMYEEYFTSLSRMYRDKRGWFCPNPKRSELDWLTKKYA